MLRRSVVVGAMLLAVFARPSTAPGAEDDGPPPNDPSKPLAIRVNQAIDSGVAWLKKQTFGAGNWVDKVEGNRLYDPEAKGDVYTHHSGPTSLALYTLLKCGVPAEDPIIVKGFDWLKKNAGRVVGGGSGMAPGVAMNPRIPRGSYEISVLIMALEAKANPHKREKERIKEAKFRLKRGEKLKTNVKLDKNDDLWMRELVAALVKRRTTGTGWRYNVDQGGGKFGLGVRGNNDMSSTQLALLALLAAERCGIAQPDAFWLEMLQWTLSQQEATGPKVNRFDPLRKSADDEQYGGTTAVQDEARGWAYMKDSSDEGETRVTTSMTSCGLGNTLICSAILQSRENAVYEEQWAAKAEKAFHDGNAWYQEHWDIRRNVNNPGVNGYHYYALYCIERVGDLKGLNLLGGHPWYTEGAQLLVDEQYSGGRWEKTDTHKPEDVLNTCFALLFLNRSTPAITGE